MLFFVALHPVLEASQTFVNPTSCYRSKVLMVLFLVSSTDHNLVAKGLLLEEHIDTWAKSLPRRAPIGVIVVAM